MKSSRNPQGAVLNRGFLWFSLVAVMLVVAISAGALQGFFQTESFLAGQAFFEVTPGPLTIDVTAAGTIKAKDQVIIKSNVEGRSTILYLVPEGTQVKEGEVLVELDASSLVDQRVDQQIRVQNAEAAYIGARESFEIVKNQSQSDIDLAELAYQFAQLDLEKYVKGDFPKDLKDTTGRSTLADVELSLAQEKHRWSKLLYDQKYLPEMELKADELAAKRAQLDLEVADLNLSVLNEYTNKRMLAQLVSDVTQAEMALERTKRKAAAQIVQASADHQASLSEYERETSKLEKTERQITNAVIKAPTDGLVVYATSVRMDWRHNEEPLDEGSEVRERQELIYLPVTSAYIAELKVHESSLEKVRAGLPAQITVSALPGKTFTGRVTYIAPLADAQSAFMNPDLKVYKTQIDIDNGNDGDGLRSGMSCEARIIVTHYEEANYVPIQSVVLLDGQATVFVAGDGQWEKRPVELGLDNNRVIRIASGLTAGETVWLTPPLAPAKQESTFEDISLEPALSMPADSEGPAPADSEGPAPAGRQGPDMRGSGRGPGSGEFSGPPGGAGEGRASGQRGRREMTPEQREEMRKRMESMSPEEREAMQQKFRQGRGQSRGEDGPRTQ